MSQQLLLLSTTAATPYTAFFFSSQWASTGGDLHWQQVYGHSAGGYVHAGFFLNKSSTVLINLCMHKSSISRVPVLQHRYAVQLHKHLPAGTWNDILETKNYGILKLELKRFLFLWGLLVWQVANHVLYNVFCLLRFGMLWELHALLAWMNGKCWNNCVTLLSGVSGHRILSCGVWHTLRLTVSTQSLCLSPIHRSSYKSRKAQQWMPIRYLHPLSRLCHIKSPDPTGERKGVKGKHLRGEVFLCTLGNVFMGLFLKNSLPFNTVHW